MVCLNLKIIYFNIHYWNYTGVSSLCCDFRPSNLKKKNKEIKIKPKKSLHRHILLYSYTYIYIHFYKTYTSQPVFLRIKNKIYTLTHYYYKYKNSLYFYNVLYIWQDVLKSIAVRVKHAFFSLRSSLPIHNKNLI